MLNNIYNKFQSELGFIKDSLVELKNHAGADLKVNGVWYCFIFAMFFIFLRELVFDTIMVHDFFPMFTHLSNQSFNTHHIKSWLIIQDQRFMYYLWALFAVEVKLPLGAIVFIFIFFVYINNILLLYIIELLGKIKLNLFIKLSFIILSFLMLISYGATNGYFVAVSAYLSIYNILLFLFLLLGYPFISSVYNNHINYFSSFIVIITGSCIVGSYSAGLFHIYYLLLFAFLYEYFYIKKEHNIKEFISVAVKYLVLLILIFCLLRIINALFIGTFHIDYVQWRKLDHLSFLERVKFALGQINTVISIKYIMALLPIFMLIAFRITKNNLLRILLFLILFLSLYVSISIDIFMKVFGLYIRFYVIYIYISYVFLCLLILYRNSKTYVYLCVLVTILCLCFFNNFIKMVEDAQKINKHNNFTMQSINNEYSKLCNSKDCKLVLLAINGKNVNDFYKNAGSYYWLPFNLAIKNLISPLKVYEKEEHIQDKILKQIWKEKSKLGISYPMQGSIIKAVDENGKTVVIIFV